MNEDVSTIKNGNFPASHVSFRGRYPFLKRKRPFEGCVGGLDVDWQRIVLNCSKLYREPHISIIECDLTIIQINISIKYIYIYYLNIDINTLILCSLRFVSAAKPHLCFGSRFCSCASSTSISTLSIPRSSLMRKNPWSKNHRWHRKLSKFLEFWGVFWIPFLLLYGNERFQEYVQIALSMFFEGGLVELDRLSICNPPFYSPYPGLWPLCTLLSSVCWGVYS